MFSNCLTIVLLKTVLNKYSKYHLVIIRCFFCSGLKPKLWKSHKIALRYDIVFRKHPEIVVVVVVEFVCVCIYSSPRYWLVPQAKWLQISGYAIDYDDDKASFPPTGHEWHYYRICYSSPPPKELQDLSSLSRWFLPRQPQQWLLTYRLPPTW